MLLPTRGSGGNYIPDGLQSACKAVPESLENEETEEIAQESGVVARWKKLRVRIFRRGAYDELRIRSGMVWIAGGNG